MLCLCDTDHNTTREDKRKRVRVLVILILEGIQFNYKFAHALPSSSSRDSRFFPTLQICQIYDKQVFLNVLINKYFNINYILNL